jgi:hypothetical protein
MLTNSTSMDDWQSAEHVWLFEGINKPSPQSYATTLGARYFQFIVAIAARFDLELIYCT